MATKKAATSTKLQCFTTKKQAQKAAALVRKVTGRTTIKAEGTCVVSTSAVAGPKRKRKKSTTAKKATTRKRTRK